MQTSIRSVVLKKFAFIPSVRSYHSTTFQQNFNQVKNLFANGQTEEALSEFFKNPHPSSAGFLIARQMDVNLAQKVYETAKQQNCNSLYAVLALMNARRKHGISNIKMLKELVHEFKKATSESKRINERTLHAILFELEGNVEHLDDALLVFRYMAEHKIRPNFKDINRFLNCCSKSAKIYAAEEVWNYLESVFHMKPDKYHYSCMMKVYIAVKDMKSVINLLGDMQDNNVQPDAVTFTLLFNTMADIGDWKLGQKIKAIFDQQTSIVPDAYLKVSMMNMYGKCGKLDETLKIFDTIPRSERDVVCWNILMNAYIIGDRVSDALNLLDAMQKDTIQPNVVTYTMLLTACANGNHPGHGELLHNRLLHERIQCNDKLWCALLRMYGSSGNVKQVQEVFNSIPIRKRSVNIWNSLIQIYANQMNLNECLDLMKKMPEGGVSPDEITYNLLLTTCANMAVPDVGRLLHEQMIRQNINLSVSLKSALINMYGKGGCVDDAESIFDSIDYKDRDLVSWGVMLQVYALNGMGERALELFKHMQQFQHPNSIILTSVLNACSHSFLVDEAVELYEAMENKWGIKPDSFHTRCIIDALARSGRLQESENLINDMMRHDEFSWRILLGACRSYKDVERAKRVFDTMKKLGSSTSASDYVLMSNIFSMIGDKVNRSKLRTEMDQKKIQKIPGMSTIYINGRMHQFVAEEKQHPEINNILKYLDGLIRKMVKEGYAPDTNWVTRDVEDLEEKKRLICLHSEKLAIAYGLMNTPEDTTITISQNLRVCGDCHEATKFIAKVTNRRIHVRDANRFHHFTPDGKCSCGERW